jgi:hypothetical protein
MASDKRIDLVAVAVIGLESTTGAIIQAQERILRDTTATQKQIRAWREQIINCDRDRDIFRATICILCEDSPLANHFISCPQDRASIVKTLLEKANLTDQDHYPFDVMAKQLKAVAIPSAGSTRSKEVNN